MSRFGLLAVSFLAATQVFAWATRPGWPALPSQNNSRIQCALARGDAKNPSAVFPLCEPGKPVACWWDDEALHVGDRTFGFKALGAEPRNGASFSVDVVADNGKPMRLDVVLDEDAAAYRVPDFGILGNRTIDLPVSVSAKRAGSVRVFSNAVGARSPRFIRDKIIKVKAGDTVEARITGPAPDSGNHIFNVYDADGTVLFMAFYPFHDPAVKFAYRTVISDPAKMTLIMRVDQWIATNETFDLTIRMQDLLTGEDTGFSATKRLECRTGMFDIPFDVTALRPGTFRMLYSVKDADSGKEIHSDYAYYAKPDGKCVWDGTDYGAEDSVPPPWTKPQFGSSGFSVWNRKVEFGGGGLVRSVRSGGMELLASPVEVAVDGRPLDFAVAKVVRKVSSADYLLKARGADISVTAHVEFDGYMWFDVTYAPPKKSLTVRVPVKRDRVVGFDDCSDPMRKLALPKGATADVKYSPVDRPWWWMGSAVGLMGGIEGVRGWNCRNLPEAVRFSADAKTAELTMRVVDSPCADSAKRTFGFYLQPTPVKPKNKAFALQPRSELVTWTGTMARFFDVKMPGFVDMEKLKQYQDLQRKGKRVFFYNGSKVNSPIQPWWGWLGQDWNDYGDPAFFAEEVMFKDRADRDHGVWVTGCLNSRSFFDHKLWTTCWFLNNPDFGVMDLYFDLAAPSKGCNNRVHGCTWKDAFGRVQHDGTLRRCREFHKRVYRELKKKNPNGAMLGHLQYQRTPADVFFDRLWMGETYDRFIRGTMSYYGVLNPEMMQIQYASRSSEVVIDMLPQIDRAMSMYAPEKLATYDPHLPENDRVNRHATIYFKIHDLEVTPQGRGADQWEKPDAVLRTFGPARTHSAYYNPDCPVSVSAPNPRFLYALFAGNGRRLLMLLNDTDDEVVETVSVKGLAQSGKDIFNGQAFDFSAGRCEVRLPPRESLCILFAKP